MPAKVGDACMVDSKLQGKPCLFPTSVKSLPALSNSLKDWNLTPGDSGHGCVGDGVKSPESLGERHYLHPCAIPMLPPGPNGLQDCGTAGWDVPARAQTRWLQSESSGNLCTVLLCTSAPRQCPRDVAGEAQAEDGAFPTLTLRLDMASPCPR